MTLTIKPGRYIQETPIGDLHLDTLLNVEQVGALARAMQRHNLEPKQITEMLIDAQGGITLTGYEFTPEGDFLIVDGELIERTWT